MYLYNKYKTQLIILDDGFQHRSLNRDVDINLINRPTKIFVQIAPLWTIAGTVEKFEAI